MLKSHNIFLISEDKFNKELINNCLSKLGHRVLYQFDYVERIPLKIEIEFNLIILDISYTNFSSIKSFILKYVKIPDIRFIFLTQFSISSFLQEIDISERTYVITKPLNDLDFSNHLDNIITNINLQDKIFNFHLNIQNFIAKSSDAIVTTEQNGKILHLNNSAEILFGRKSAELKNTYLPKCLDLLDLKTHRIIDLQNHNFLIDLNCLINTPINKGLQAIITLYRFPCLNNSETLCYQIQNTVKTSENIPGKDTFDLLEEISDGWFWTNLASRSLKISRKFAETLGYHPAEFPQTLDSFLLLIPKDDREVFLAQTQNLPDNDILKDHVFLIKCKNGSFHKRLCKSFIAEFDRDQPKIICGVNIDLSNQSNNNQIVESTLHNNEVLLRELQHRVKNNLQLIISLIKLQSEYIQDDKINKYLFDTEARIRSLAIIYEMAQKSDKLDILNLHDYIYNLSTYVYQIYTNSEIPVETIVNIDSSLTVSIGTAIHFGLLLNEILSNSFKHAFQGKSSGKIILEQISNTDIFTLCISDNGVGFSVDENSTHIKSFGLQLIHILSSQLQADVSYETYNGTKVIIKIPYKKTNDLANSI